MTCNPLFIIMCVSGSESYLLRFQCEMKYQRHIIESKAAAHSKHALAIRIQLSAPLSSKNKTHQSASDLLSTSGALIKSPASQRAQRFQEITSL